MSLSDSLARRVAAAKRRQAARVLLVFSVSLFLSAALLFSVQPMFAKMVLPRLGGAPAVWSTLMVCFQAVLLAGYAYAHLLARRLPLRWSVPLHLAVLLAAALALPVGIGAGWEIPPEHGQSFWLIALFGAAVAIPFFALSANAPLLQAWFARSGHEHAGDPYFLYGASNIGSFAALLGYPLLLEPLLPLGGQAGLWAKGYLLLVFLVLMAGLAAARAGAKLQVQGQSAAIASGAPVAFRTKLAWAGLAFVPSGLLIAVTSHISTDVAAAPFLWVAPLALFLATFVLIFRRTQAVRPEFLATAQIILVAFYVVSALNPLPVNIAVSAAFHLALFFIAAMVCHGELYRLRPQAGQLTEFYLWMSLGGVLGGIFAALLAPLIFSTVLEYPLLVLAALMCRAAFWRDLRHVPRRDRLIGLLALIVLMPAISGIGMADIPSLLIFAAMSFLAGAAVIERRKPARSAALAVIVLISVLAYGGQTRTVAIARSFFGVHKIMDTADGAFRLLIHGTTLHGAQALDPATGRPAEGRPVPRTYYYQGSPLGDAVAALRPADGGYGKVGVIGLGTGTMACHARPGENWTFFEIDAAVVCIARRGDHFRFLNECAPQAGIVLGDARLTLRAEQPGSFDLLLFDAFSSDAIPVHLLTKEALGLYTRLLSARGNLVFHISNRHMELAGVLAAVAHEHGWKTYVRRDVVAPSIGQSALSVSSIVAVVTRTHEQGTAIADDPRWQLEPVDQGIAAWSDDFSDIISAMWRRYRMPGLNPAIAEQEPAHDARSWF